MKQEIYNKLFDIIFYLKEQLNPLVIKTVFEIARIKSLKTKSTISKKYECSFHLRKAIQRKFREVILFPNYKTNRAFKN